MAKILHHNDDDGRCAAFLTKQLIIDPMTPIVPDDFIEYNYVGSLASRYPKIVPGEPVYIVDISLCDDVLEFIRYCIAEGANVLHIDHHHSSVCYMEHHAEELNGFKADGKYRTLIKEGISGAMLTWIYAEILNSEDILDPDSAKFDFDDDNLRTKCCRVDDEGNPVDKDGKEITSPFDIKTIPEVLRYIDDNDIWKHKISSTMAFSWGFRLCENKHPLSAVWSLLFDETINAAHIGNIIDDGEVILRYRKITDFKNLYNGFYVNIDGHNVVFLNTIEGNSSIFQEVYDYADAVCKYSFTGNHYTYTFYSKDDGANCLDIVTYLCDTYRDEYGLVTGGGHLHASGVTFKKDIVNAFEIDKKSYAELRKKIRIDKEIAIEQKRYEEEQKKLAEQQAKLDAIKAKVAAREAELEEEDYDYDF